MEEVIGGVIHELIEHNLNASLGYLTNGVAACLASLRDRLRQTQADLLTVPKQELHSAITVRPLEGLGSLTGNRVV